MGQDRAVTKDYLLRYGGAVLAVAAAAIVRMLLAFITGGQFPLGSYFLALVVVAWYGGLGPSLVTLALSIVAIPLLEEGVWGPSFGWMLETHLDAFRYTIAGFAIAVLGGRSLLRLVPVSLLTRLAAVSMFVLAGFTLAGAFG